MLVLTGLGILSIVPLLLQLSRHNLRLFVPVFRQVFPSAESLRASRSVSRMSTNHRRILGWVMAITISVVGCQKSSLRSQNPDDDEIKKSETQYIQEMVTVSGLNAITIESVGLVCNLDGTGGDPPPSIYRSMLLNEMRRRGVSKPNTVLDDPNHTLVLVRASVPPVIEPGDRFDVEVIIPESCPATSLKGGYLMPVDLAEQAMVPGGRLRAGHIIAKAEGPIMLSTGDGESASRNGVLKRGRILGGAKYSGGQVHKLRTRTLSLYAKSELRSVRTTKRIAEQIGKRFHSHEHGIKKALAEAKTDQQVELKIHPTYKENYMRYVRVIRRIAVDETPLELRERMERLRKQLLVPQTASSAATELEAIGSDSVLILKEGLKSPNPEVRFYSADSLAYLGDGAGISVLDDAARNEPAFRIYALAALTTLASPESRQALNEMMLKPTIEVVDGKEQPVYSAETRYGAFRALWTIDQRDEFIGGESFHDEFKLHIIDSLGDSMVHLTRFRVPQIVLFGRNQKLITPLNMSAGRHIMISAPSNSDTVTISRFHAEGADEKITTSTNLADIIRALGRMHASYPDVAQMLFEADRGSNLDGRLEIDAMPAAGRIYYRTQDGGGERNEIRVGDPNQVPNMFPTMPSKNSRGSGNSEDSARDEEGAGTASLVDVSEEENEKPRKRGMLGLFGGRSNDNSESN